MDQGRDHLLGMGGRWESQKRGEVKSLGDRTRVGEGPREEGGVRSFPSHFCLTPRPRSCCYSPWTSGSS